MKKNKWFIKIASIILCISLFVSSVPAFALYLKSDLYDVFEQDMAILAEEKMHSFIFQYDIVENKDDLINRIEEAGGIVGFDIGYLNAISAMLTMDHLAIIKEMECVIYIEQDYDYNLLSNDEALSDYELRQLIAGQPSILENNAKLEQNDPIATETIKTVFSPGLESSELYNSLVYAHEESCKGQNIKIALFDTGIAEHPDYTIRGGVSFADNMLSYMDTDGHGTKMAGIIAAGGLTNPKVRGTAPQAELYAVKLVETEGKSFITTAAILMGIGWSIDNGMNIINMSFGTYFHSKLLQDAISLAYAQNILLVSAVGNDGGFEDEYRIMYPAAYENVIAVGAGSAYGTESFSNNNEKLDFVAPGRLQSTMLHNTYIDIVGTSASAAYFTGLLAGLWSNNTLFDNVSVLNIAKNTAIVADDQIKYVGYGEITFDNDLKNFIDYVTLKPKEKSFKNSEKAYTEVIALEQAARQQSEENVPEEMTRGNCFVNEMACAMWIDFFSTHSGKINCPGNEVWYKFTANNSGSHPNGSPTDYFIDTKGSQLDTVLYLYDSSGNQLAYSDDYNGTLQSLLLYKVNYNQTYYIRVKAYGSNTGYYKVAVHPNSDEYGDTFETAYIGPAIWGVYYEEKSINGFLTHGDYDFFKFVPARDCVMEIYTTGSTDTFGTLYDECQSYVTANDNGGGNYQFKITAHLKGMQYYYIRVHHSQSSSGDYTLRFKFIRDYSKKIINDQYSVFYWYNNDQSDPPYPVLPWSPYHATYKHRVFISDNAKGEYRDRVIDDLYKTRSALQTALQNPTTTGMLNLFAGMLIDLIPYVGAYINYAIDTGKAIYDGMNADYLTKQQYISAMNGIENQPTKYIQGTAETCYVLMDFGNGNRLPFLTNTIYYTTGSGDYYGVDYSRGEFTKVKLREH